MRKRLLTIIVCLALVISIFGAIPASAATIAVTVTPSVLSISVDQTTWAPGTVAASGTLETGETWGLITDDGSETVTITIGCDGWAATSNAWTYAATPDAMTGNLEFSSGGTGGYTTLIPSSGTADLTTGLVQDATINFGLEINAPTSFATPYEEQSTTVTITAVGP